MIIDGKKLTRVIASEIAKLGTDPERSGEVVSTRFSIGIVGSVNVSFTVSIDDDLEPDDTRHCIYDHFNEKEVGDDDLAQHLFEKIEKIAELTVQVKDLQKNVDNLTAELAAKG